MENINDEKTKFIENKLVETNTFMYKIINYYKKNANTILDLLKKIYDFYNNYIHRLIICNYIYNLNDSNAKQYNIFIIKYMFFYFVLTAIFNINT